MLKISLEINILQNEFLVKFDELEADIGIGVEPDSLEATRLKGIRDAKNSLIQERKDIEDFLVEGATVDAAGVLDEATARSILAEAGNDKELARKIAQERGFNLGG